MAHNAGIFIISLKGSDTVKIDINSLIKTASRKLGMPEEKLREAVKTGDTSAIRQYLSSNDRDQLDKAMNDKALAEKIKRQYSGK